MELVPLSWIETGILLALLGACWTAAAPATEASRGRAILCSGLVFLAAAVACADFYWWGSLAATNGFQLAPALGAPGAMAIDNLNAPLLPLTALIFLVTILVTLRTKVRRFSFARTLVTESMVLATLCSSAGWLLVMLLVAALAPPWRELRARGQSRRVFAIHSAAFAAFLVIGWRLVEVGNETGYILVAAGIAIRAGLAPAHCWVTDLFEKGALGTALLTMAPMTAAYAALRLLAPAAPEPVLAVLAVAAACTAVYAAGMALVQTRARRFLCFLFLSHSALVFAGIALSTALSLTGGLSLWISVMLAMTGLGLTLRSLEARTGRVSLRRYLGFHSQTPMLAAFFLITGLAAVGFPGTIGFFGAEMLVDGAGSVAIPIGVAVVLASALNSISVVRAYAILFLGTRHPGTANLGCRRSERLAILTLTLLLVGGAVWPQAGIESRFDAARQLLRLRR